MLFQQAIIFWLSTTAIPCCAVAAKESPQIQKCTSELFIDGKNPRKCLWVFNTVIIFKINFTGNSGSSRPVCPIHPSGPLAPASLIYSSFSERPR